MLQRLVANWLRQQAQDMVAESSQEADASESPNVHIVVIFSSASEAGGMVDKLSGRVTRKCSGFIEHIGNIAERRVAIVETSETTATLVRIVRDLVELRSPDWVCASGFACGAHSTIRRGDIVVANRVVDADNYSLDLGTQMPTAKALHVGPVLGLDCMPTANAPPTATDHEFVAYASQVAVIAEVCRVLKTRMLAVHVVAQNNLSSKSSVAKQVGSQESIAGILGTAAGALLEKPSSLKELWQDKESTLRLSDRVAHFLISVIDQL